jgi:hypothetical protein
MEKIGRQVSAYHPEILVRRAGKVIVIRVDMDDWYEEGEVLGKLAAANPSCRTVGELVEAIESGEGELSAKGSGVMACCISDRVRPEASTQAVLESVRQWDEPI